jgi:hypothetical protein
MHTHTRTFVGNPEQKRLLANLSVNGRIILKRVLNKQDVWIWTRFTWLRIGAGGVFCEQGNKFSSSIRDGTLLDLLINYQLFEDPAPCS